MNTQKKILIEQFVNTLPILRAAIGASQADVATAVGISRQTYCALEQKKEIHHGIHFYPYSCFLE